VVVFSPLANPAQISRASATVIASAGIFQPVVSGASVSTTGTSPLSGRSVGRNGGIDISHAAKHIKAMVNISVEKRVVSFIFVLLYYYFTKKCTLRQIGPAKLQKLYYIHKNYWCKNANFNLESNKMLKNIIFLFLIL
jgi:hypothetical protein